MPLCTFSILHVPLEDIPEDPRGRVTSEPTFQALVSFPDHRECQHPPPTGMDAGIHSLCGPDRREVVSSDRGQDDLHRPDIAAHHRSHGTACGHLPACPGPFGRPESLAQDLGRWIPPKSRRRS